MQKTGKCDRLIMSQWYIARTQQLLKDRFGACTAPTAVG